MSNKTEFNTVSPGLNGWNFVDEIVKGVLPPEKFPRGPNDNELALVLYWFGVRQATSKSIVYVEYINLKRFYCYRFVYLQSLHKWN